MRFSNLISSLQTTLDQALERAERQNFGSVVAMENDLALKGLKIIFETYKNADVEINSENAKPFIDYLANRWDNIKGTNAIYSINFKTDINKLCIRLAKELGQLIGVDAIKLLMPTLKVTYDDAYNKRLIDMAPQEYILTDDNTDIVNVFKSLESMEADEKLYTTQNHPNPKRLLTDAERERVVNHSILANDFYKATSSTFDRRRNALNRSIHSDFYVVEASYGKVGDTALQKYVFSHVHDIFKDREEFIQFLLKHIDKKEEISNLLQQCEKASLEKLVLGGTYTEKFALTVNSDEPFNGVDLHDKLVFMCLAIAYWNNRKAQPTTNYSYFQSFQYTLDDKKKGIDAILDFCTSNLPLKNWESFIDTRHVNEKGALANKDLGILSGRIKAVSQMPVKQYAINQLEEGVRKVAMK